MCIEPIRKVTACLENMEMSGNLTAVGKCLELAEKKIIDFIKEINFYRLV